MDYNSSTWWLARPRLKRLGGIGGSLFFTFFPAFALLAVTALIVTLVAWKPPERMGDALIALGTSVARDALAIDGIIIGVLASLLIAQVLAKRPQLRSAWQLRRFGSVALFAHALAGVTLAVATLCLLGALRDAEHARQLWVILVATGVAIGVAQWIDRYWSRNRRLVRSRIRTTITMNAWVIHRAARSLRRRTGARTRPAGKLLIHVVSFVVLSTLCAGVAAAAVIWISGNGFDALAIVMFMIKMLQAQAFLMVLWLVCGGMQAHALLERGRQFSTIWWLVVSFFTVPWVVALLLLVDYANPNEVAFAAGFITQLVVPYLLLLLNPRRRLALVPRINAYRLWLNRRWRVVHLRDLYAVDWRPSEKARKRRVRQASLRRNRPRSGPASSQLDGEWGASFRMYARGR